MKQHIYNFYIKKKHIYFVFRSIKQKRLKTMIKKIPRITFSANNSHEI